MKIAMYTVISTMVILAAVRPAQAIRLDENVQLAQPLEVMEGKVVKASDARLVIHRDSDMFYKNINLQITNQTKIEEGAQFHQLQKGDLIKVSFYEDGKKQIASRIVRIDEEGNTLR